ncbi:hypothetical protein PGT21_005453 [Puccinia graminis f. sp. tritici]|uniref:Uncharacterized protein n=2 Tax=Puccinia graminis f. sp. tritici TaxID=56615 RepID=H6QRR8_PUCGT|nr:uncharacterized protein PGTG_21540 [Puccinia graminis f. sp. tritici CRL 75-36-700-3]EHS63365.1 hypothetical protein PGTG_21540 [Puccinia graminis f. sp. tritici CRL 75-36-700-3]KAA1089062.1 hypothetical protein PGT21_005453 [Puccinia graminis f. sp. tritici]
MKSITSIVACVFSALGFFIGHATSLTPSDGPSCPSDHPLLLCDGGIDGVVEPVEGKCPGETKLKCCTAKTIKHPKSTKDCKLP